MEIAYVASSAVSGTNGGGTSSHTIACNVGSGTDRGLIVHVWSVGNDRVTGVTYAGIAMSLKEKVFSTSNIETMTSWILPNPTSGSNNIVVTASAASEIFTTAAAYTGVDQTDFVDVDASTFSSGTPITTAPTPTLADCWLVAGCGGQRYATASTGLTALAGDGSQGAIAHSAGVITNGVAYTNSFTVASPLRQLLISTVIKPSGGGGGGTIPSRLMMMGVGV